MRVSPGRAARASAPRHAEARVSHICRRGGWLARAHVAILPAAYLARSRWTQSATRIWRSTMTPCSVRRGAISLALALTVSPLIAQTTGTVRGRVTDAADG